MTTPVPATRGRLNPAVLAKYNAQLNNHNSDLQVVVFCLNLKRKKNNIILCTIKRKIEKKRTMIDVVCHGRKKRDK